MGNEMAKEYFSWKKFHSVMKIESFSSKFNNKMNGYPA